MPKPPKKTAKPRAYPARRTPSGEVSPQFQICALLMAKGDLARGEIARDVTVANEAGLTNALFNAKAAGRITLDKTTGKYSVTPAGRDWATGGANLDNQRASAAPPSPVAVKRSRREAAVDVDQLDTSEQRRLGVVPIRTEPVARPSFRCAVDSVGGFFLEKSGTRIDLEPDEHRSMLRYLDRMNGAEQAAA